MATHKIKYGDTLSQIALDNGTSVDELLRLNPQITNRNLIRTGDTLNLPDSSASAQTAQNNTALQNQPQGTSAGTTASPGSPVLKSHLLGVSDEQYTAAQKPIEINNENVINATNMVNSLLEQLKQPSANADTLQSIMDQLTAPSAYDDRMKDLLDQYLNREAFAYDQANDPLFQQTLRSYTDKGEKAMKDTIARAAAQTGGYANSWAQTVGQQTYDQYLQDAYDMAPEYYKLALDAYDRAGTDLLQKYSLLGAEDERVRDRLLEQYNLLSDADKAEYNRLLDQINLYTNERESAWDKDYKLQSANQDLLLSLMSAANAEAWKNKEFDYNAQQDAIANARAAAAAAAKNTYSEDGEGMEDEDPYAYLDPYVEAAQKLSDKGEINRLEQWLIGLEEEGVLTPEDTDKLLLAIGFRPGLRPLEQKNKKQTLKQWIYGQGIGKVL